MLIRLQHSSKRNAIVEKSKENVTVPKYVSLGLLPVLASAYTPFIYLSFITHYFDVPKPACILSQYYCDILSDPCSSEYLFVVGSVGETQATNLPKREEQLLVRVRVKVCIFIVFFHLSVTGRNFVIGSNTLFIPFRIFQPYLTSSFTYYIFPFCPFFTSFKTRTS